MPTAPPSCPTSPRFHWMWCCPRICTSGRVISSSISNSLNSTARACIPLMFPSTASPRRAFRCSFDIARRLRQASRANPKIPRKPARTSLQIRSHLLCKACTTHCFSLPALHRHRLFLPQRPVQSGFDRVQFGREFDWLIGVVRRKAQFVVVVFHLHLHELQPVRRGNHDHALSFFDLPCF